MFKKFVKYYKNEIKPLFYFPLFFGKMNNSDYVHIINTFFNLDYTKISPTVPPNQYKNEEWLKNRIYLFEKFCLPSMISQTDKNFIWICHVHEDSPEFIKNKFEEYQKQCPQLKIIFGSSFGKYQKALNNFIRNEAPRKKYLVTTRFDSDDMMASDYIENIHRHLYKGASYFIDFVYGYIYDAQNDVLCHTKFRRNPFCSRVEKMSDPKTIYVIPHTKINQAGYVCQIKAKPMWAQIIHGSNILNKLDGDVQNDKEDFKARFKISDI